MSGLRCSTRNSAPQAPRDQPKKGMAIDATPGGIVKAINQKDYATARKAVNTAVLKSPKSSVLRGLNALLYKYEHQKAKAVEIGSTVVDNTASVAEFGTVRALVEPVALAYGESDLLIEAYDRCARRTQATEANIEVWTNAMLAIGSWWGLSRSLIAANKHQSSQSSLYRVAFSLVKARETLKPTDPRATLLAPMALKFIEKTAAPSTPQHAYAKAHVIYTAKGPLEAAEYALSAECQSLQSLNLKLNTLNWLVEGKQWAQVELLCRERLPSHDSFDHWKALVKAVAAQGKDISTLHEFFEQFQGHNVALARVEAALVFKLNLSTELINFWQNFHNKPSAFRFAKSYAPSAEPEFLQFVKETKAQNACAAANRAKMMALLGSVPNISLLVAQHSEFINEKPEISTDYYAGTDLLVLAATETLKSLSNPHRRESAAALLEYAVQFDPSSFNAKLLLIYIYQNLGAQSLALKHYEALSLKNLQLEAISAPLLQRSGTLGWSLSDLTQHYSTCDRLLSESFSGVAMALENEVYTQIPGMLELRQRLLFSVSRSLFAINQLHKSRLDRGKTVVENVLWAAGSDKLIDLRDSSCEFDISGTEFANGKDVWQIRAGPWQTGHYVGAMQLREGEIQALLRDKNAETTFTVSENALVELTPSELQSFSALKCAAAQLGGTTSDIYTAICDICCPDASDWEFFHSLSMALETAKVVADLGSKHKCSNLSDSASKARQFIRKQIEQKRFTATTDGATEAELGNEATIAENIALSQNQALTALLASAR